MVSLNLHRDERWDLIFFFFSSTILYYSKILHVTVTVSIHNIVASGFIVSGKNIEYSI